MGTPHLHTQQMTERQMLRALMLVEKEAYKSFDDVMDIDDSVDCFEIEVSFSCYLDTIELSEYGKEPCAYIYNEDREILEADTALFRAYVKNLLCEASLAHRESTRMAMEFESDKVW